MLWGQVTRERARVRTACAPRLRPDSHRSSDNFQELPSANPNARFDSRTSRPEEHALLSSREVRSHGVFSVGHRIWDAPNHGQAPKPLIPISWGMIPRQRAIIPHERGNNPQTSALPDVCSEVSGSANVGSWALSCELSFDVARPLAAARLGQRKSGRETRKAALIHISWGMIPRQRAITPHERGNNPQTPALAEVVSEVSGSTNVGSWALSCELSCDVARPLATARLGQRKSGCGVRKTALIPASWGVIPRQRAITPHERGNNPANSGVGRGRLRSERIYQCL